MRFIRNYVHHKKLNTSGRTRLFVFLTTLSSSLLGLVFWFVLHFFVLNEISWAICFAGYPGVFVGFIGGIIYLYRHNI